MGLYEVWHAQGEFSVWSGSRQNYRKETPPVDFSSPTEVDLDGEELSGSFTDQAEPHTEDSDESCDPLHEFLQHFPRRSPEWWHQEQTEGESKHRRNLLDDPLRSPSFGNGVAMHANNETYLSEFMIGLMIVEAFCIFLLSLYPPAKPYKKRIIGGGYLILYSGLPFCQCSSLLSRLVYVACGQTVGWYGSSTPPVSPS